MSEWGEMNYGFQDAHQYGCRDHRYISVNLHLSFLPPELLWPPRVQHSRRNRVYKLSRCIKRYYFLHTTPTLVKRIIIFLEQVLRIHSPLHITPRQTYS